MSCQPRFPTKYSTILLCGVRDPRFHSEEVLRCAHLDAEFGQHVGPVQPLSIADVLVEMESERADYPSAYRPNGTKVL
jgi:hypothetical protein